MIKSIFTKLTTSFFFLFILTSYVKAQKTVFSENFNAPGTPQSSTFSTTGKIGDSRWTVTRSGKDFGARIADGILTLSNDATKGFNNSGWVMATTSTSNYDALYNPILSRNVGVVSWTFNMRQIRANPSGLGGGRYGSAFVLAGTANTTNSVGRGYAIVLGKISTTDPIQLVTYYNGLASGTTVRITSSTMGLTDFGSEYTSVRVEYNPAVNKWSMYLRKDNPTSFQDPNSGTLVFQQEVPTSDFINETLPLAGAYWNALTAKEQTAFFDNFSVSVETPELISLDPDSKIANSGAFTLTLNGKGFLPTSKVYWNGTLKPTVYISPTQLTAAIPATEISLPSTVPVTVVNGAFTSNALDFIIEASGVPALTLSATTLPRVSAVTGTVSNTTNTYTINGVKLVEDVKVTAPANFEISKDGTNYFPTLTLEDNVGVGNLTGQPITLRARIISTTLAGNYTGNIEHKTSGAVTKLVAVSGKVFAKEPISPATNATFTNVTSTGFKLNWTTGNGEQRLVIIREGTAVSTLPSDGTTYTANAAFGTGSQIGTGNFAVYKGTGNSVAVTGLQPTTKYYISIVEFNGLPSTENYRENGAIESTTTLNSPVGLQIKLANTSYKINFDETVDGVNLDAFQGIGIAKIAETGQLDSDSWAFSGFSGGNIGFDTPGSAEDSSYENGPSEGDEIDTGIYAFNVGTNLDENYTLGIQPGGTDFNPGTITLRIQNQTGTTMTSVNVGYKVYIYNDQPSSSKISFSSNSSDTGTFTNQSIVDVISPPTADLAPGWKAYYRVVTVPTGNIANNAYYYIRWSGLSVSGTGPKDEFAIDDIEVIANPATNTVAFDGIAEDFVLQGNASLSSDLSVQNKIVFNGGKLAIKDKTLTIAGSVTNTTENGLTGGATSKLVVRGIQNPSLNFDQITPGTSNLLDSFSLIGANPNTVIALNNFSVNATLRVDEQQILNLGTTILSGTLNSIQNNGKIQTQNTSTTPFTAGKTWGGSGILEMNATSSAQTLVAGIYDNLTLSSAGTSGGTTATGNVIVKGILDLPNANPTATKGSLAMGILTLTMGEDAINKGVGDVTGIIQRNSFTTNKLYTFGHPNSSIIFPPGGTLPSTMRAKLTIGEAPTWRTGAIKRQFDITQTGGIATKALIRQHYLDSEINGNIESKMVFWGNRMIAPLSIFEQGKSSNNTTDNWVEISNANVAQYFGSDFNQVYITLDDTQGLAEIVWNGSESKSWTTIKNWTPNVKPTENTKVIIPVATSTNFDPELNPSEVIGSLVIETGGIVNSTDTSQLILTAGSGAWQNYGTFNPGSGTSTITFNNLDATIAGSTTFNNITIPSGAGIRPSEGNYMSIAGVLTNKGTMFTTLIPNTIEFKGTGQTIPAPGGEAFGGYHNLIVSGTGTTIASTILNVRGNLKLDQSVSFTGKTINLAGVSDQTIGGNSAITFDNLIIKKETGKVVLAKDITIGGTLSLTAGNLVIGANNLTLGSIAVSGIFNNNNMIIAEGTGLVRRPFTGKESYLFPIGITTGASTYSPVTVDITAGTFSNAFVEVNVTDIKHPNNYSLQNNITKYWNISQTGITNAVATITATYDPLDVIGSESEIAAAQLNGTFNAVSNPWIKFGALSNNTLVATDATLTSGVTSAFTGLKAGTFSVEVEGYGDFCVGSEHSLTAVTSGGNAPYNYTWTPTLENAAVVAISTTTAGTTNYVLTVKDANGFTATDTNIPVTILPASVGGTVTITNPESCSTTLELKDNVGKVLYWQRSTTMNFTDETTLNIGNITNILTNKEIGIIDTPTYFRAVVQNGSCGQVLSNVLTIESNSTTWNNGAWSDGTPTAAKTAIFAADYEVAATPLIACNIKVNADITLTIKAGSSLTIQNDIINYGDIIVESDGNLVQVSDTGEYRTNPFLNSMETFTVKRNASLKRLDYVYWSSPVTGQNLKTFSPGTVASRFLTYNEWDDKFTAVPNITTTNFAVAKGYAIRASNYYPVWTTNPAPLTAYRDFIGVFTGIPNTGTITFPLQYQSGTVAPNIGYGNNLVGNPYPSNLRLDGPNGLFTQNTNIIADAAYFWTNVNANVPESGGTYSGDNYAIFNESGGKAAANSLQIPTGIVKVGQGFIVKAKLAGKDQNLVFNNGMRDAGTSIFFDRKADQPKDRFWLRLTTPSQNFTTLLIAYVPNATNGFEYSYDAPLMGTSSDALFSILEDYQLGIQGRQYPLNPTDVVTLGTNSYTAGNHVISLQKREGIFEDRQNIYLKDHQTNTVTNLSNGDYTFEATAGLTEGRFEIIYKTDNVLGTDSIKNDDLIVYREGTDFIVKSAKKKISDLEVYDTSGRLMIKLNPNQTEIRIDGRAMINGVYILKINQNGKITTRKIIR